MSNLDDKTKAPFEKILGPTTPFNRYLLLVSQCGRSTQWRHGGIELGYKNVYRYPGGMKHIDEELVGWERVNDAQARKKINKEICHGR